MDYLYSTKNISIPEISLQASPDGRQSEPQSLVTDAENEVSLLISSELGFHIFPVSWVSAYHTSLLLINNSDPCKVKIQLCDQFGFTATKDKQEEFDFNILNSLLLSQIRGWWLWVQKNFSKTNAVSKLWKITRIIILFLSFNTYSSSISKANELDTKYETIITEESKIYLAKDSLIFLEILKKIDIAGFKYIKNKSKAGGDSSIKERLLGNDYQDYNDKLVYCRYIPFDSEVTEKPMCAISQLIFEDESIARAYIEKLESNFACEQEAEFALAMHRTYFTKAENIIYLFEAWVPYFYNSVFNLKCETDKYIIKPNQIDQNINENSSMNILEND